MNLMTEIRKLKQLGIDAKIVCDCCEKEECEV